MNRPCKLEHSVPAEHGPGCHAPTSLFLGGSYYFGIGTGLGSGSGVWDPHLPGMANGSPQGWVYGVSHTPLLGPGDLGKNAMPSSRGLWQNRVL